MLIVERIDKPTPEHLVERHWTGATWRAFIQECAQAMGDAARINILELGGPGGEWPQLSGFQSQTPRLTGAAKSAEKTNRTKTLPFMAAKEQRTSSSEIGRRIRARRFAGQQGVPSVHSGYAKRKALGKTPGKGLHGPEDRLLDTGALFASLQGKARFGANEATITLVAVGRSGRRPTNAKLLEWHAFGTARMPARNPAQKMEHYEEEIGRLLVEFLSKAP